MSKKMSNKEFVNQAMDFSKFGPLAQMVLLNAIRVGLEKTIEYREQGIAEYNKKLEQAKKEGHIYMGFFGPSWFDCAQDLLDQYNENYN